MLRPLRRSFHRPVTVLCFVLLLCSLAACAPPPEEPGTLLTFEPIGQGQTALLEDTVEVTLRDAGAWTSYQQQLRPLRAFQDVDFDEEMVVLVAVPARSGGYSVEVAAVEERAGEVVVRYRLAEPGRDCITTMATAVPFQAVRLPHSDTPVRFERQYEQYRCTF